MLDTTPAGPARPATWLEIVRAALDNGARIQIHPIRVANGIRMAVSLASRPLCSTDGRITLFEDLAAAARFLSIAGVRRWSLGEALQGVAGLVGGAEQWRLKRGRLCT
ncbi:MAG: hypothetical protein KDG55_00955 [Rhodocyclaceae bacterium]|nr:hypothetical protein [Rhodocyclaceae bacterium]